MDQNAICCAAVGAHERHKTRPASEWSDLRFTLDIGCRHRLQALCATTFIVLPLEVGPSLTSQLNKLGAFPFQFPTASWDIVHAIHGNHAICGATIGYSQERTGRHANKLVNPFSAQPKCLIILLIVPIYN